MGIWLEPGQDTEIIDFKGFLPHTIGEPANPKIGRMALIF